jgi:hypothetical protein
MHQFYPFKSIIMFLFLIFRVVVTNLSLSFLKYTVYFYQKDPLKRSSDRAKDYTPKCFTGIPRKGTMTTAETY